MSREYKDSGIDWIGDIPKGWKIAALKQIGTYINGYAFKPEEWTDIGKPIIRIQDLTGSMTSPNFYNGELDSKYLVTKGDILVSWAATLDAFIWQKEDGWLNQHIFKALPSTNIYYQYFFWLIKVAMENMNNDNKHGIVMQHVTTKVFGNFNVCIPTISEQQKIADYLDKVCGEVDELVALQETMIEELKAYKQSIITEAVTKGLNPHVPMRDSGIDWIGEIPEHWKIMPIKYIKSKEPNAFVDGPFGSNLKSEHFIENGDVLVVESGFISTGKFIFKEFKTISKEHFETIKRSQCKAKDIIIAKIGANYGMAGELPDLGKPSVVSGNSLKITLDNSKMLNTIFVNAMICAKSNSGFKGMVQENAQPALSLSGLNNFKLPVPPLSEQQSIASYLDTKCTEIDALIAIKQAKIEELKDYKKSVIYEYVTGKKEVV